MIKEKWVWLMCCFLGCQDFVFLIAYWFSTFFSSRIHPTLMSVGTYLCKLLIFVWYNVNGIEPFLNPDQAPNFFESLWNWRSCKSRKFSLKPTPNCETLPNFYKKKTPKKGREKKKTRTKVQATKQPKRGGPQGGKGTSEYQNLHQLLEAY